MESECNGWVKTINLIYQYILVGLLLTKKDGFPINFVWLILQKKKPPKKKEQMEEKMV